MINAHDLNAAELADVAILVAALDKVSGETQSRVHLGACEVWAEGDLVGTINCESGEYAFRPTT